MKVDFKSTIAHNPLFRYLDSQFVDSFFDSGELLLTTYRRCRAHEDLVRRDDREGKFNYYMTHENSAIAIMRIVGDRSYMLCTSSLASRNLAERFRTDSHFVIEDPSGFCDAISAALPGLQTVKHGPCEYLSERSETKLLSAPIQPNMTKILAAIASGEPSDLEELFNEMHQDFSRRFDDQTTDVSYFAKPNTFAGEEEFRMIWTMDEELDDGKIIYCPDARQFCKRAKHF